METFAELLTAFIRRAGITDAELARRVGVARLTVFRWKAAEIKHPHNREMILAIARALHLSLPEQDRLLLAAGFGPEPGTPAVPPASPLVDERWNAADRTFVGREHELARLEVLLGQGLAGRGRVGFVVGEPGAGKSMLVAEFARRAQHTHGALLVMPVSCSAQPYLPFIEVLRLLMGDVAFKSGLGQDAITAAGAARLGAFLRHSGPVLVERGPDLLERFHLEDRLEALGRALPGAEPGWLQQLRERRRLRQAPETAESELDQTYIFAQYWEVLQALAARRPLLMVLDNLHEADADSLKLLYHLGQQLEQSRLVMVGSYRPAEVFGVEGQGRHPLAGIVNQFQRRFGEICVDLDEIGAEAGRQFVDALLDTEPNRLGADFREALYQHTAGHALFTVELLRDMVEKGSLVQRDGAWEVGPALDWGALPARVEGVIAGRVARLEPGLRRLLDVASVEGLEFTSQVLAGVLGVAEAALIERLHRLDRGQRMVVEQEMRQVGGRWRRCMRSGRPPSTPTWPTTTSGQG